MPKSNGASHKALLTPSRAWANAVTPTFDRRTPRVGVLAGILCDRWDSKPSLAFLIWACGIFATIPATIRDYGRRSERAAHTAGRWARGSPVVSLDAADTSADRRLIFVTAGRYGSF